jgi:rhamnosyltransferase
MANEVLVSIIIPVKNGDAWLKDTIPAILGQVFEGGVEVIVIDSGSTDETLNILKNYPVRLVQIDSTSFNHGATRNLGATLAEGKYVVMTVQDAKPASSDWLKTLLNGFVDETVAGVCGLQIVPHHKDKNPVDWFRPISSPEMRIVHFPDSERFRELSPDKQLSLCRWDNVNAAYRREILLDLPFRKTDFAEDAIWAKDALLAGHSLVYQPAAQVEHYHTEDYDYAFKRNFSVQYHFFKYFGQIPVVENQTVISMLRTIKLLFLERRLSLSEKIRWYRYNSAYQRAVRMSNRVFIDSIDKSNDELDAKYSEVCKIIPQAIKPL